MPDKRKQEKQGQTTGKTNHAQTEKTELGSTAETVHFPSSKTVNGRSARTLPDAVTDEQFASQIAGLPSGRYVRQEEIGAGAMGVVSLAEDTLIQRPVALKSLKQIGKGDKQQNFLRETRIQGQLQHPNIVTVYDAGLDESGQLSIVMQYIQGMNLSAVMDELRDGNSATHARFPIEARLDIFSAIINGLSYAHSKELIHCDVKPANVIIGKHGEVWLADWGIARASPTAGLRDDQAGRRLPLDEENTNKQGDTKMDETLKTGAIFGTPRYMSPEQAIGNVKEVDAKSDIYSAFILLYELLTLSEWVSNSLTLRDTLDAAANRIVPEITDEVFDKKNQKSVPTELRYLLNKGLAHDRSDRFRDCEEVLDELLRIRNGQFAIRCPITFIKRLQNKLAEAIDRHPQLMIFSLLLIAVVWVLGTVGGVLYLLN